MADDASRSKTTFVNIVTAREGKEWKVLVAVQRSDDQMVEGESIFVTPTMARSIAIELQKSATNAENLNKTRTPLTLIKGGASD